LIETMKKAEDEKAAQGGQQGVEPGGGETGFGGFGGGETGGFDMGGGFGGGEEAGGMTPEEPAAEPEPAAEAPTGETAI
jgi:hypothetical protein